jgi:CBS domain-containing protein
MGIQLFMVRHTSKVGPSSSAPPAGKRGHVFAFPAHHHAPPSSQREDAASREAGSTHPQLHDAQPTLDRARSAAQRRAGSDADRGVRHLPVLEGGKLVGILSQRDALLVETLRDIDPTKVQVEDAMTADVYVVSPDESLVQVAEAMADHKYGCAVVMDSGHLSGIFTTVDALRALMVVAGGAS